MLLLVLHLRLGHPAAELRASATATTPYAQDPPRHPASLPAGASWLRPAGYHPRQRLWLQLRPQLAQELRRGRPRWGPAAGAPASATLPSAGVGGPAHSAA